MNYAVIYQSKSGNTRRVAEEIYESISSPYKGIYDIDQILEMPKADIYFVGFGIRNNNCGIDIINCLEQITDGSLAIFATCGYAATEQYKEHLEKRLHVWLSENTKYLGMFLCQGSVNTTQQETMLNKMPDETATLMQMFEMGSSHPNDADMQHAAVFASKIQYRVERSSPNPIL